MQIKKITIYKAEEFRDWLRVHHNIETKVAVVVYKRHTGKPAPTHRELINEAICFGWIDTTIKRIDENRYMRYFSRRNKNSRWSDNTLRYARELIKEGRMTPAGHAFYDEGLKKPTHDEHIPKNPSMPVTLARALQKNKTAKKNFDAFPPSTKRMLYRWLLSAKLPQTTTKRIEKIVEAAKKGNRNVF
jgi:uncharacterized protein YdeI (YjbR/CyaY-like superfamily)